MGTNFYWKDGGEHIGKRSAAGLFCWDCGVSKYRDSRNIHFCESGRFEFTDCPGCGKSFSEASEGANLLGIGTCASFMWTMLGHKWRLNSGLSWHGKVVVNEYGEEFTAAEFLKGELLGVAFETISTREFS